MRVVLKSVGDSKQERIFKSQRNCGDYKLTQAPQFVSAIKRSKKSKMFQNCQGHVSSSNISVHAHSHSSYTNNGGQAPRRANLLASCMQAVCGLDPGTTDGRKYSTTMEDNSSITAHTHHNLNFEDECRITLSRFNRKVNGRDTRFIKAKATLFGDEVDEAHDLFYLVKMPENSPPTTQEQNSPVAKVRRMGQTSSQLMNQDQQDQKWTQQQQTQPLNGVEKQKGAQIGHQKGDVATSFPPRDQQQIRSAVQQLGITQQQYQQQQSSTGSAGGAYHDFINQHTGSFTFHPRASDPGSKSLLSSTSSQPNLAQDGNIFVLSQAESGRCDTETPHKNEDANLIEYHRQSPARFIGGQQQNNNPEDQYVVAAQGGRSELLGTSNCSASSRLLIEKHGVALASGKRSMPRLPRTYADLVEKYTVAVKRDRQNGYPQVAVGQFPLSKVPDGKYRIYYFRPKNRNRIIGKTSSSAQDKIQRVGKGQEFYIFDRNSSESPSKISRQQSSINEDFSQLSKTSENKHPNNYHFQLQNSVNATMSQQQQQQQQSLTLSHNSSMTYELVRNNKNNNAVADQQQKQPKTSKNQQSLKSLVQRTTQLYIAEKKEESKTNSSSNNKTTPQLFKGKKKKASSKKTAPKTSASIKLQPSAANLQLQAQNNAIRIDIQSQNSPLECKDRSVDKRDVSPEEIDQYVVQPISTETDPYQNGCDPNSKDSFNTDKIRRENLSQNFTVTMLPGQQQQNLMQKTNSHQLLGEVLTFGHNSISDERDLNPIATTNSVPVVSGILNFNSLAGMQELYKVHQQQIKQGSLHQIQTTDDELASSVGHPQECPDTPNLYQHTQNNNNELLTYQSIERSEIVSPSFHVSSGNNTIEMMSVAPCVKQTGPQKFALQLNLAHGLDMTPSIDEDYDSNDDDHAGDQADQFGPPEPNISGQLCNQQDSSSYQAKGAAIRIEKQTSYSKQSRNNDSSCSSGAGGSSRKKRNSEQADDEELEDITVPEEHNGTILVTSAFTAAELQVRKSQVQIFNINNSGGDLPSAQMYDSSLEKLQKEHTIESIDVLPPSMNDSPSFRQVQGPQVSVPLSQILNHKVDNFIIEQVMSPRMQQESMISQQQLQQDSLLTDEMGNSQISFLQKLLDTRGPQDGYQAEEYKTQPGSQTVTVMGGSSNAIAVENGGNSNDQPVMVNHQFAAGCQGALKHSRATIAFSDQNAVGLEHIPGEMMNVDCYDSSYQSPEKDAYGDIIRQQNSQNNQGVNFDQLTRNTVNNGSQLVLQGCAGNGSDRKQLSTVEEENASQCSDLTSLQQHHSRFLQTQHSSSRKQLRSSVQPNNGQVAAMQPNLSSKKIDSFCIYEEQSEAEIADQVVEIQNLDDEGDELRISKLTQRKISYNEAGGGEVADCDDTDEKARMMLHVSANVSTNSTKTCSKQTSAAAGISSVKIDNRPFVNKKQMQQNSDYYIMKTQSPEVTDQNQYQPEIGPTNEDESSSSLRDLEDDFNVMSYIQDDKSKSYLKVTKATNDSDMSKTTMQHTSIFQNAQFQQLCDQEQIKKTTLASSPYTTAGQRVTDSDVNHIEISNFKSKRPSNEGMSLPNVQNVDADASQESIQSVNLTGSEHLLQFSNKKNSKKDESVVILPQADQCTPSSATAFAVSRNNGTLSTDSFQIGSKTSLKRTSNRMQTTGGSRKQQNSHQYHNIFSHKTHSAAKGNTPSSQQEQQSRSSKEQNSGSSHTIQNSSARLNNDRSATNGSLSNSYNKQPRREVLLTPQIGGNQTSGKHPNKLHQLVQKTIFTPQTMTSKKKKVDLQGSSQKRLAFQPIIQLQNTNGGSQGNTPSSMIILQPGSTKSNKNFENYYQNQMASPSQPLLKQREIFQNRTNNNTSANQSPTKTQAQLFKAGKKNTCTSSKKKLNSAKTTTSETASKTLTTLLLHNISPS